MGVASKSSSRYDPNIRIYICSATKDDSDFVIVVIYSSKINSKVVFRGVDFNCGCYRIALIVMRM